MACGNTYYDNDDCCDSGSITPDYEEPVSVSSVTVCPGTVELTVGEWFDDMRVRVLPSDADNTAVRWRSSNTAVAGVNAVSGRISAVAPGTARITATAADGSGHSDYVMVTVTDDTSSSDDCDCQGNTGSNTGSTGGTGSVLVESVEFSPDEITMTAGDSMFLKAVVCPETADNKSLRWSSSNPDYVTVNPSTGLVYACSEGDACIYAMAQDGSGAEGMCRIIVKPPKYVKNIYLSRTELSLSKGETYTLSAEVCPANAHTKTVRFNSSDASIATVDVNTGIITAVSAGNTVIYANATDGSGVKAGCKVTVMQNTVTPEEDSIENPSDDNIVADPVDAYTGAHIINSTLMSLYGGQRLKFNIRYDSTRLVGGMIGKGWYHNYEKRIEVSAEEAKVYSSPSVFSRYVIVDHPEKVVYECVSVNKGGYMLTVDCAAKYQYVIDCNSDRTEYYNAEGMLVRIRDHQSFETLIEYGDALITITDMVSGKRLYLDLDGSGRVVHVRDDAARAVELVYSGNLLTEIYDLSDGATAYTYDECGRITSGTDPNGICYFENTYDE
ncbi:MAG: Ig-like domain-containing protein, partial [Lachnospiraceae bacterium]|nr:Ig-like domain-containing protein [Lachnospiraceae bacterium]